jgi:predicted negative regulator of RcsB-dependent stress response
MRELDSTRIVTQQVVKYAAVSFMVAAVEVVDQQERQKAIGNVSQVLAQSKQFHERLIGALTLS